MAAASSPWQWWDHRIPIRGLSTSPHLSTGRFPRSGQQRAFTNIDELGQKPFRSSQGHSLPSMNWATVVVVGRAEGGARGRHLVVGRLATESFIWNRWGDAEVPPRVDAKVRVHIHRLDLQCLGTNAKTLKTHEVNQGLDPKALPMNVLAPIDTVRNITSGIPKWKGRSNPRGKARFDPHWAG